MAGLAAPAGIAWLLNAGPVSRISGQSRDWIDVLRVAVLGPVAEETLFRGAIWNLTLGMCRPVVEPATRARWIALLLTSIPFGLMHVRYWLLDGASQLSPDAIAHVSAVVAARLLFGAVRLWSRSLTAPIVIHVLANSAVLFSQTISRS